MTKRKTTYLDYNATAPLHPEVREAMLGVMGEPYNPSSVHAKGREAKQLVHEAREHVAKAVGAEGAEIIFTGSGTEANHLALWGLRDASALAVSAVEHVSVLKPASMRQMVVIPVDANGLVDLDALKRLLERHDGKVLVSVQLANNETGVIQPVSEIAALVYQHGGYMHCDASQGVGKIPVDFTALNVDMMTISAHKFGGPQGATALVIKSGLKLEAIQLGG
ncbi:MAG: aminotransferase class V-fold PLP-dependent enzyme, partial [Rickettsiales bacterium]|nr:aminotransferase class V-fold PLP-dependent enzyme [Rickettsiales bacterium]